jgi:hypothetical protein
VSIPKRHHCSWIPTTSTTSSTTRRQLSQRPRRLPGANHLNDLVDYPAQIISTFRRRPDLIMISSLILLACTAKRCCIISQLTCLRPMQSHTTQRSPRSVQGMMPAARQTVGFNHHSTSTTAHRHPCKAFAIMNTPIYARRSIIDDAHEATNSVCHYPSPLASLVHPAHHNIPESCTYFTSL